jgi:hypothetical protein
MARHRISWASVAVACVLAGPAAAQGATCANFTGSTAKDASGQVNLPWRTDFPATSGADPAPWTTIDFKDKWREYLAAVLSTVKSAGLKIENGKASMAPGQRWWISPWMDYTNVGREPTHGLTKERTPRVGDLAQGAPNGGQIWAVGFYNAKGAQRLRTVFKNPCNPKFTKGQVFAERTASFKLLFTDLDQSVAPYLAGAPTINALIDPAGADGSQPPSGRVMRPVRLLQVDIAVRDKRATDTGWVLGTYVWRGPRQGDGLFDNLVPVGLSYGNDPGVFDTNLRESRINPDLAGLLYARPGRAVMGFNGRANGPADNKISGCLSCHATSQWPASPKGSVGTIGDNPTPAQVQAHVTTYFKNVKGGSMFDATVAKAVALDYSLQLQTAFVRLCRACQQGALTGPTPQLCRLAPSLNLGANCPVTPPGGVRAAPQAISAEPLPRQ